MRLGCCGSLSDGDVGWSLGEAFLVGRCNNNFVYRKCSPRRAALGRPRSGLLRATASGEMLSRRCPCMGSRWVLPSYWWGCHQAYIARARVLGENPCPFRRRQCFAPLPSKGAVVVLRFPRAWRALISLPECMLGFVFVLAFCKWPFLRGLPLLPCIVRLCWFLFIKRDGKPILRQTRNLEVG
jgi:hypothetical protein